MRTKVLINVWIAIIVAFVTSCWGVAGWAEWVMNTNFPVIGDPNAQKGGTIRQAISSYPATFRTHGPNSNESFIQQMSSLVYQRLVNIHPDTLETIPELAEAWEIQDDNKTFLFRLNPNARWADGQPVTPDDVIFSYDLVIDPNTEDPYSADLYSRMFDRPEIVDAQTVKFTAKTLHWRNFLFCGANLPILPAHTFRGKDYVKDFNWDLPNGSGPYQLAKFEKGQNIILKRRDDFWAKDERAYQGLYNFDELRFVVIRDDTLEFEKFKKGDLDVYTVGIAKRWVEEMDFDKIQNGWIQKRKIYNLAPKGHGGLAINMRRPFLQDVRVRKALAYLYNRELFMEKLFFNEYLKMYSFFPGSVYENANNEKIEYNPSKAQELLAEAGWNNRNAEGWLVKDGQPLTLNVLYPDKVLERHLTIYQEDAKKAGIDLKLKLMDWSAMLKLVDERNFDLVYLGWTGMLFPNPEPDYHSTYADMNDTNNITGIKVPRVDEILDAYPGMFDVQARITALQELDGLVYQEFPYVLSWYAPFTRLAYWNKFGMPTAYATKFGDVDVIQTWWYDKEKDAQLQAAVKQNTKLPVGETIVNAWREPETPEKK